MAVNVFPDVLCNIKMSCVMSTKKSSSILATTCFHCNFATSYTMSTKIHPKHQSSFQTYICLTRHPPVLSNMSINHSGHQKRHCFLIVVESMKVEMKRHLELQCFVLFRACDTVGFQETKECVFVVYGHRLAKPLFPEQLYTILHQLHS